MTNDRIREVYNRVVPVLAVIALAFAVVAVGWSWQNSAADHRQDVQHDKDQDAAATAQAHLITCFDDFATQLAGGLPLTRNAGKARNAALTTALGDLEDLLVKALAGEVTPEQGQVLIGDLVRSLAAYRKADQTLLDVQADNPFPASPSEFCPA